MWCCQCNRQLGSCVCPDLQERLARLRAHPNIALRECRGCGEHADRCTCGDGPTTVLKSAGREVVIREPEREHKWYACGNAACGSYWRDDARVYNDCGHEEEPVEIPDPTKESK